MSYPFMMWAPGDYHKDTRKLDDARYHGAYILILMEMWNSDGELPFDDTFLRKIACVKPRDWPKVWEKIGCYFLFGDGIITHKRITSDLKKAEDSAARRAAAGAKGGKATAKKGRSNAGAMLKRGRSKSESSQPIKKSTTVDAERPRTREAACDADAPPPRVLPFPKKDGGF